MKYLKSAKLILVTIFVLTTQTKIYSMDSELAQSKKDLNETLEKISYKICKSFLIKVRKFYHFKSIIETKSEYQMVMDHMTKLRELNYGYLPINEEAKVKIANAILSAIEKGLITRKNIGEFNFKLFKLNIYPHSLSKLIDIIAVNIINYKGLNEDNLPLVEMLLSSLTEDKEKFEALINQEKNNFEF